MKIKLPFIIIMLLFWVPINAQNTENTYEAEIQAWQAKREASLKSEDGWLNLAGLFRLKEGKNTFGAGKSNDIIFPKGEAFLGNFILENGQVRIEIEPNVLVLNQDKKVDTLLIFNSKAEEPILLQHQSLRWFIIQRGDQYLVRLRDLEHSNVTNFKGIERFPTESNWRIEATLEPAEPDFKIQVADVIGTTSMQASPGAFAFDIQGQTYRLYPTISGDELFFVFGDATNGDSTYGAGRFLYAAKPDANGKTMLDFNKSYNPPCAFTAFATCPLPSKENILPIEIKGGEKNYGNH